MPACVQSGIDPRQVAAIAFDSQMAGVGSIDEDFQPATRFDSWLDMRCQPYIEQLDARAWRADHPPDRLPAHLRPRPENPVVAARATRSDYARIAKFVMPAGYVAGRMAGLKAEPAFIDYTFIHFSALSDAQAGQWSRGIVQPVGRGSGQAAADRRPVGGDR